jgi:hypothetical protein
MTVPPLTVTNLTDARELKAVGLPPNLPLVHKTFSLEYSERWFLLQRAYANFLMAINEYSDGARAGSSGKWQLVKRRIDALRGAMQECDGLIGRLNGGDPKSPVYNSDQDRDEASIMAKFLVDRAMPFVAFWEKAIETVDGGTPLTINWADIPIWIDRKVSL